MSKGKINVREGLAQFLLMEDSGLTGEGVNDFFESIERNKGREYCEALRGKISLYAQSKKAYRNIDPNVKDI